MKNPGWKKCPDKVRKGPEKSGWVGLIRTSSPFIPDFNRTYPDMPIRTLPDLLWFRTFEYFRTG
jgi:hypothetical protein